MRPPALLPLPRRPLAHLSPSHTCRRALASSPPPATHTLPRPYTFHIGASYARKPPDSSQPEHYRNRRAPSKTFGRFSDKGRWRDGVLARWAGGDVGREGAGLGGGGGVGRSREEEDREHAMGEDFLFVQPMQGASGIALGIADGVGGWSASGVDPSLFSQSVMFHAQAVAARGWAFPPDVDGGHAEGDTDADSDSASTSNDSLDRTSNPPPEPEVLQGDGWLARPSPPSTASTAGAAGRQGQDEAPSLEVELEPREILQRAYDGVLGDVDVDMGASTACVLTLNAKTGKLRAANLGDSGFLILRGPSIQHIQPAQTHYFNCPKQLSKYPKQAFKKGTQPLLDQPSEADVYECTLRHGDVVLLYTDGLSDNVFASELLELSILSQSHAASPSPPSTPSSASRTSSPTPSPARPSTSPGTGSESSLASSFELDAAGAPQPAESVQAQRLARMCVERARGAMGDVERLTPFDVSAKSEGGWEWWDWIGGKIDDVTVIAVVVTEGM